ncbi:MAG TPA: PP2C family protein-serine/threonine phosphatase [Myxococcota bacterium]|nr:PP2C family protein-serine/threonine phosphatase [Myxococcota bacterium]
MQVGKRLQFWSLVSICLIGFAPVFSADNSTREIKATAVADKGGRIAMEDTHVYGMDGNVFYAGVYDGHGGNVVSDFLVNKETALHNLILKKIASGLTVEEAFRAAYQETDELLSRKMFTQVMGSTAVNVIIKDKILYVANIGNTEAMVINKDETENFTVLSEIHTPSMPSEYERITKSWSKVAITNGMLFAKLNISRAFGDFDYKKPKTSVDFVLCKPHTKSLSLLPQHRYVIAMSKGLPRGVHYQAIAEFIRIRDQQGLPIETIAQELLTEARKTSNDDNLTLVLVKLD